MILKAVLVVIYVIIPFVIASTSVNQLKHKEKSLLNKLENVHHQRSSDIKRYRGPSTQELMKENGTRSSTLTPSSIQINYHQNYTSNDPIPITSKSSFRVYNIMEEEALIMRTVLTNLFQYSEIGIRISSNTLRIVGDTIAGFFSSFMRGLGGMMNLMASLLTNLSLRVNATIVRDGQGKVLEGLSSNTNWKTRQNLVITLKNVAYLLTGMGHACIWGGEISEAMTLGIGEAVQDSFKGLEFLSRAGYTLVQDVLQVKPSIVHTLPTLPAPHPVVVDDPNQSTPATIATEATANSQQQQQHHVEKSLQEQVDQLKPLIINANANAADDDTDNQSSTTATTDAANGSSTAQRDQPSGPAQPQPAKQQQQAMNNNDDEYIQALLAAIQAWYLASPLAEQVEDLLATLSHSQLAGHLRQLYYTIRTGTAAGYTTSQAMEEQTAAYGESINSNSNELLSTIPSLTWPLLLIFLMIYGIVLCLFDLDNHTYNTTSNNNDNNNNHSKEYITAGHSNKSNNSNSLKRNRSLSLLLAATPPLLLPATRKKPLSCNNIDLLTNEPILPPTMMMMMMKDPLLEGQEEEAMHDGQLDDHHIASTSPSSSQSSQQPSQSTQHRYRSTVFAILLLLCYGSILFLEQSQRQRLIQRTAILTLDEEISQQVLRYRLSSSSSDIPIPSSSQQQYRNDSSSQTKHINRREKSSQRQQRNEKKREELQAHFDYHYLDDDLTVLPSAQQSHGGNGGGSSSGGSGMDLTWVNLLMSSIWSMTDHPTATTSRSSPPIHHTKAGGTAAANVASATLSAAAQWFSSIILDESTPGTATTHGPSPAGPTGSSAAASAAMGFGQQHPSVPVSMVGGLGPYISDIYYEIISNELSNIPPQVANLRLKRFDFGIHPPYFKDIQAYLVRNETCMALLEGEDDVEEEDQVDEEVAHHQQKEQTVAGRGSSSKQQQYRSIFEKLVHKVTHHKVTSSSSSHKQDDDKNTTASSTASSSSSSSRKSLIKDDPKIYYLCDRLVAHIDLLYASKEMDIVLSLRSSDLKSMFPEMTIALQEVIFAGEIRLEIALTPDYPFLGNTTMSFTRLPSFDFSIKSFGGRLDLTTIPMAFYFVNSSVYWMLQQYTTPHSTLVDLRHLICPSCDLLPQPTLPEVIYESTLHVQRQIHAFLAKMKMIINGVKTGVQYLGKSIQGLWHRLVHQSNNKPRKIHSAEQDDDDNDETAAASTQPQQKQQQSASAS